MPKKITWSAKNKSIIQKTKMRKYYIYIPNKNNTVNYTGVTNDLYRQTLERRTGKGGKFIAKYRIRELVFYEEYDQIENAILQETQFKGSSRQQKNPSGERDKSRLG